MSRDRSDRREYRGDESPEIVRRPRPRPSPQPRPRQRDYYDEVPVRPQRTQRGRRYEDEYYDDEYDYEDEPAPRQRRARPARRKKQRAWPWVLLGCGGGMALLVLAAAVTVFLAIRAETGGSLNPIGGLGGIGNTTTFTQKNEQTIPVTTLTTLTVHNQIGDVTITVDPHATQATVTTTRKVKAASQSDADKEFPNITVQVQPTGTQLAINATVPGSDSLMGTHNDSVDIALTLPPTVNNTNGTPLMLNSDQTKDNITSVGNVSITGLDGILAVKDDIGNVTVKESMLYDGSHLMTGTGNVTFNGLVDTNYNANTNGEQQIEYKLQSETGNVDVTIAGDTNVVLDANTNVGKITSDFDLNGIKNSDGSIHGPLQPGSNPNALLVLDTSSGNIVLHKSQQP